MIDDRYIADRMYFTETTCDKCDSAILASERRAVVTIVWSSWRDGENEQEDWLVCESCASFTS